MTDKQYSVHDSTAHFSLLSVFYSEHLMFSFRCSEIWSLIIVDEQYHLSSSNPRLILIHQD